MVAHTVCFTAHKPSRVRVSRVSPTGFDNYEKVITIPASRLPTGHDLVFVASGISGNHIRVAGSLDFVEVAPYFGTPPFGALQTFHMFRQLYSFAPYNATPLPPIEESHTGKPFFIMCRKASWVAATDFNLVATIRIDRNLAGEGGSFDLDALAVQVWDLTELNAAGVAFEIAESFSNFDIPDVNASPVVLNTLNRAHGSSTNWLTYFSANATPKNESAGTEFWLDNGAGGEHFIKRINSRLHGLPPGNPVKYEWQRYALGNMRATTLPATWTLRSQIRDSYAGGVRGRHFASMALAIEMPPLETFMQVVPPANPYADFWGTGEPWDGNALEQGVTFPHFISGVLYATVATIAAQAVVGLTTRWRTVLEVEGAPVSGNFPLAALSLLNESLPQQRVATHALGEASGGKTWVSFRGNKHWADPQPLALLYPGYDAFLLAFNGILGVVPPAPVIEEPGPETPVLASRETSVSISSLPELPYQPASGSPLALEGTQREMRTGSQYSITHPKAKRSHRTVRFTVPGLSAADASTLLTFLRNLAATRGAFRWKDTDELAHRAYSVIEASIPDDDLALGGPRDLSFDGRELLFVTP